MSDTPEEKPAPDIDIVDLGKVGDVDVREVEEWKGLSEAFYVPFGQRASLQIARWVLLIFGAVYVLCFGLAFYIVRLEGATYDKSVELVHYMLAAILPLVTLAVGFYLGEKSNS